MPRGLGSVALHPHREGHGDLPGGPLGITGLSRKASPAGLDGGLLGVWLLGRGLPTLGDPESRVLNPEDLSGRPGSGLLMGEVGDGTLRGAFQDTPLPSTQHRTFRSGVQAFDKRFLRNPNPNPVPREESR